jgi:hypothetical protein
MNFLRWGITLLETRSEWWPKTESSFLPDETWYRAVSVEAPVEIVFRWICQLRLAPYSYDWIDNFGRPSPRQLVDELVELEIGQEVMTIFKVHDFVANSFMTIVPRSTRSLLYSRLRITYLCLPVARNRTRLLVRVQICYPKHRFRFMVRSFLPAGDLLMMRKQLLTLRRYAEGSAL